MKNTRKILTILLSLALLVAGFSISAFAGSESPLNADDYDAVLERNSAVLEFYESGAYFEMRFDDEWEDFIINESEEGTLLKGGAFESTVSDGLLSFSSINETKVDLKQEAPASFGVNVRAKLTADSSLGLYVVSSATGDCLSIFGIKAGSVSHKFDPTKLEYTTEEFALAADEFFELTVYVAKGANTDTVTYSVTTEGGATVTGNYSYDNTTTDFIGGKFEYDGAYLACNAATVDYVEMYPGSYQRYVDNSKNVDVIAQKLAGVYTDYLAYKNSGAFELAEIIAKIAVLYEYPLADVTDASLKNTVTAAFAECVDVVSKVYENNIAASLATMQGSGYLAKPYNDRLDTVNTVLQYMEYMNSLQTGAYAETSGVDFAKVNDAFESAFLEALALYEIEANSIFVIEALSYISNIYLATYEELEIAYETISEIEICETYYSEEYPADVVADAVYKKNVVVTNYPELKAKAEAFVMGVMVAQDADNDFSSRYTAYVMAKNNRFTDDTYDKHLLGVTIADLNAMFDVIDTEMRAVSTVAEAFLAKIREAEQTPSYTVKIEALDEAKNYIDVVEVGYPEVEAAIASYYEMRADVASRQEAARRYIQSVLNVQIASGVKAKLAAIELAESFAVLGNEASVDVEGMSMTVTEANIVLSNEKSAILLKATRIDNYVTAVNEIANKNDLLARRQAIAYALTLKAGLVDDAAEEDVIGASADLTAAIAAYNADVNTANTAAETTETVALTLVAKTVPTKRIAEVVAIVKKFYE